MSYKKIILVLPVFMMVSHLFGQKKEDIYFLNKGDTVRFSDYYDSRFNCHCPISNNVSDTNKNNPYKWTKENGGFFYVDSLGYVTPAKLDSLNFETDTIPKKLAL